ncbi:O-antigen ligase family protein [Blastococcus deserti]|uniref:O-antigen ligase family protein n=1 Tax=Blastococcus deserti TaxID=2259033 RepID=A0ABW4XBG3_9ACTN
MDPWLLAATSAVVGFVFVVLLCLGKPLAGPAATIAWGCAVFTAEAGLVGAGTTSGSTLTLPKLIPLFVLLVACAWLALNSRPSSDYAVSPPLRWAIWYVCWLVPCALLGPYPLSGLLRVAQIALPLVVVIVVRRAAASGTAGLLGATIVGCAAHVVYAVFVDADYVGVEGEQRLTGLLIANTFGLAAAVTLAGAFGVWLGKASRRGPALLLWTAIAVSGYALVQAAARTAAIAVLLALVAAISSTWRLGKTSRGRAAMSGGALVMTVVYVIFQPQIYSSAASSFIRGNTELFTLTGRLPLWGDLLTAVADNPLFGYGPAAFRNHAPELGRYLTASELGLSVAHNALVEALVSGGLIAGLLWLALMVSTARHVVRVPKSLRPVAVALYMVGAVSAITSSSAAGIGMGWYLLLALAVLPVMPSPAVQESPVLVRASASLFRRRKSSPGGGLVPARVPTQGTRYAARRAASTRPAGSR